MLRYDTALVAAEDVPLYVAGIDSMQGSLQQQQPVEDDAASIVSYYSDASTAEAAGDLYPLENNSPSALMMTPSASLETDDAQYEPTMSPSAFQAALAAGILAAQPHQSASQSQKTQQQARPVRLALTPLRDAQVQVELTCLDEPSFTFMTAATAESLVTPSQATVTSPSAAQVPADTPTSPSACQPGAESARLSTKLQAPFQFTAGTPAKQAASSIDTASGHQVPPQAATESISNSAVADPGMTSSNAATADALTNRNADAQGASQAVQEQFAASTQAKKAAHPDSTAASRSGAADAVASAISVPHGSASSSQVDPSEQQSGLKASVHASLTAQNASLPSALAKLSLPTCSKRHAEASSFTP